MSFLETNGFWKTGEPTKDLELFRLSGASSSHPLTPACRDTFRLKTAKTLAGCGIRRKVAANPVEPAATFPLIQVERVTLALPEASVTNFGFTADTGLKGWNGFQTRCRLEAAFVSMKDREEFSVPEI